MFVVAALGIGVISGSGVPVAQALPYGCESVAWGPFGTQKRQLCDGILSVDGSWMRQRIVAIPAGYRDGSSQCYGGGLLMGVSVGWQNCTTRAAGLYPQVTFENITYRVYPDSIPAGEPGYLRGYLR